jgi:ribosomal protein L11 methyltransferase
MKPIPVARVTAGEAAARRIVSLLAETLEPYGVAAAATETARGWAVEVHFVRAPERKFVRALVRAAAGSQVAARLKFAKIGPKDWLGENRAAFAPVRVGRFVVHGGYDRHAVGPNEIGIEIEAALAFGTGHHGTTQGCLAAIERAKRRTPSPRSRGEGRGEGASLRTQNRGRAPSPDALRASTSPRVAGRGKGRRVHILDLGTGTGVLAIAAARAFRSSVVAGDIDPVAIEIARANAQANHAAAFVRVVQAAGANAPAIRAGAPYDLVLANILLGPLKLLARPVARLLAPRATVVLSGLLPEQANAALAAWLAQGLRLVRRDTIEGWVTLTLARSVPASS